MARLSKGISCIIILLCLYIDDQTDQFLCSRSISIKSHIIGNCLLRLGGILCAQSSNNRACFIRSYRDNFHRGLALNIFFNDLLDCAILLFRQAAFHDPCRNIFLAQQPFTCRIALRVVSCSINRLCQGCLNFHAISPPDIKYCIIVYFKNPLYFSGMA